MLRLLKTWYRHRHRVWRLIYVVLAMNSPAILRVSACRHSPGIIILIRKSQDAKRPPSGETLWSTAEFLRSMPTTPYYPQRQRLSRLPWRRHSARHGSPQSKRSPIHLCHFRYTIRNPCNYMNFIEYYWNTLLLWFDFKVFKVFCYVENFRICCLLYIL